MGARIPPNVRPRRGGIRCEFCGRVVPSTAALHAHQAALHSQALKEKARQKTVAKSSKVQKPEQRKAVVKKPNPKVAVTATSKSTKKLPSDENISKTPAVKPKTETLKSKTEALIPKTEPLKPKTDNTKPKFVNTTKPEDKAGKSPEMEAKNKSSTPAKARHVEYKCPKCDKLFPVLFGAQKHIQKYHSANSKGEKVAELKPILLELCIYCNKKFSKPHDCPNRPDPSFLTYDCSGCQQRFKTNKLFDMHVADVHGYQSESMFFPSEEEFITWKGEMESQTECEYVLMGKYNSRQIFRCSEHSDNGEETSMLLCPSSIILKKCSKGLQTHFFPSHYEHEYKKYELKDEYKTYSITDLIQQAGYTNGNSDDDLYLQFKTLMESIVLEAAKINIDTLKTLMSRATDMMSFLQEYDEDEEVEMISNRSMISISTSNISVKDNDDSKLSESLSTRSKKRCIEEKDSEAKRKRKNSGNANILVKSSGKNSMFSLADDKDSDKILKELDSENKTNKEKQAIQSPSFNDTYKDFIMNTSKTIIQTKPSVKKKKVVKTKMGQFKGPSPKKIENRDSIGSTKDIEYEVREREDDCNILVLKI